MGARLVQGVLATALALLAGGAGPDPLPEGARPLSLVTIDQSVRELLSSGYTIVSMNEGITGAGFLLRKERDWVLCTLGTATEATPPVLYSICQRLGDD